MKSFYTLLLFTVVFSPAAIAQKHIKNVKPTLTVTSTDTISPAYKHYFEGLDSLYNDSNYINNIDLNPKYYRLFVPLTYYYSPIRQAFKSPWEFKDLETISNPADILLPIDNSLFNETKRINKSVNKALLAIYISHPTLVVNTEEAISHKRVFQDRVARRLPPKTPVIELFRPDPVDENVRGMNIRIRKPNFWIFGGNGSLQFTQNYISSNWYKGGESTNSVLSNLQLSANYNDKEKMQFDNLFEAKIGFNTLSSDTVRKYRINTDQLRITSKLGIQAASKWYYTISTEFNTQFFRNYKSNSSQVVSAFMAPANLMFSIGMDYKLNKKKINLSVFLSPATYNMRYVGTDKVDETQFGLEEGRSFLHDFGSKFQTTMKWTVIPSVVWESRLYYFSNYKKVEAEWENTFNFVLNRYLSTKLFVHARYDDGVTKTGDSYFQIQELLSFGINYKW